MSRWWMVATWTALLGLLPAAARAQPGLVPPSQVAPAPPPDPLEPAADGRDDDPLLGRGVLLPTAITLRAGDFTMGYLQPLAPVGILALSAGLTDRVQLTGLLGMVYEDVDEASFGAAAKVRLTQGEVAHLAVQAGLGRIDGDDLLTTVGVSGSLCLSHRCGSLLSGYLAVGAVHSDGFDEPRLGLSGISFIGRLSEHVRVVAELEHPMEAGYDDNLFLAGYGVRVTNGDLAAELLFIRPLGEDLELPMGLPMLTLTVRTR